MRLFSKTNFWSFVFRRSPLFAGFVRRWGGEKKGGGEKHSPDSQEPIFNILVAAQGRAKPSVAKKYLNCPHGLRAHPTHFPPLTFFFLCGFK